MTKYIKITEKEFALLHSAVEEKVSLSEGADCNDYIAETKKTVAAMNRIIDRNGLKQGFKIDRKNQII
ncbi:hypothetical protein GCM10011607_12730 [Shewanella inventionis]|uniref:Uncharacterized protein n=1 Tax=Shewanella inventionis TaxID=1738770 RepID=A0ABQ1IW89_9GAMM|nr:hypothetical protein [Shewanella inventionis]GGB53613.1 hypothetical protein GCM10011607_12730 [Shewanella inventionis]